MMVRYSRLPRRTPTLGFSLRPPRRETQFREVKGGRGHGVTAGFEARRASTCDAAILVVPLAARAWLIIGGTMT